MWEQRASMEINNLLTSSMRELEWPVGKTLSEMQSSMLTTWAPLKTELPADLHLIALGPREAATSTVALQLLRLPSIGLSQNCTCVEPIFLLILLHFQLYTCSPFPTVEFC